MELNHAADRLEHVASDKVLSKYYLLSMRGFPANAFTASCTIDENRVSNWRKFKLSSAILLSTFSWPSIGGPERTCSHMQLAMPPTVFLVEAPLGKSY